MVSKLFFGETSERPPELSPFLKYPYKLKKNYQFSPHELSIALNLGHSIRFKTLNDVYTPDFCIKFQFSKLFLFFLKMKIKDILVFFKDFNG
jgi:hypothetical protein